MSQETIDKLDSVIEELSEAKELIESWEDYDFPLDNYLSTLAQNTRVLTVAVDAQVAMIRESL